jgi:flavin-dependent dehydrogenase
MNKNYDLVVIGGGPGGTAAAITSARKGARVLLLERGRFPRQKVCGEFISPESLSILQELLETHSALLRNAVRISKGRLFVDGRVLEVPINPAALSIARFDLDNALLQRAEAAGVMVIQQGAAHRIVGESPFYVQSSVGDFTAKAVVDASGRWSNLNSSQPGNGIGKTKWIGVKAHFIEPSPAKSVDLYFFNGGYCGVQPVTMVGTSGTEHVNACAMVKANAATTLGDVLQLHPALASRSRDWQAATEPSAVAPLIFAEPQPVRNHTLRVGDAACFVDPFVGDGISLALRSGFLAAQCLVPFFRQSVSLHDVLSLYKDRYERELLPVFRSSSKLRKLLQLPPLVRDAAISVLSHFPAAGRYMVRKTR